jgi:small subunit ribosomal protein S20
MNKKQRNRKLVEQNKRNRIINRRYTSTIKSLSKLLIKKVKIIKTETDLNLKTKLNLETKLILNNFYSIVDKAVKKNVIKKNTAARKKSRLTLLSKFNIS